jgi:hypothetical protein
MRRLGNHWKTGGVLFAATFLFVGCGQDAPPYDELPLRDALRAAPEVVATMPFDTRHDLAVRLDAAGLDAEGVTRFEMPEKVTIDGLSRIADAAREDQGQDALIFGSVVEAQNDFLLSGQNIDEKALGQVVVGPVALRGNPSTETAALEDAALRGRAGAWLRELSGRTHTKQMVRTSGLPFGAWAYADTLYVNGSWLVAMAALEENVALPGVGDGSLFQGQAPDKTPLSVDYNPYNLPETLAECVARVQKTCECGASCTHEVTDPSFANANEECAWVNQDLLHPAALCVAALLSVDDIFACMDSAAGQCSVWPVSSPGDALLFAQNVTCMDLLDICLRDGSVPDPPSSGSGSSCNNSSGGSGSGSSCSKCNDDCSKCNDNWADCNDNCSNTNQNCSSCGSSSGSCGKCSIHGATSHAPIPVPFPTPMSTGFWLIAPAAYLFLRGRRRS